MSHTCVPRFRGPGKQSRERTAGFSEPFELAATASCPFVALPSYLRKIARVSYLGLAWIWQKYCRIPLGCDQTAVAEVAGPAHVTLRAEWLAELAHERLFLEYSLARLHVIQSELASLQTGQFALGDVD